MSLPPRQKKAAKRTGRFRCPAHRTFVRTFQCAIPGCVGMPVEFAHLRMGSGAGMGEKPDDWRGTPLCRDHHHQQHTIGEPTFWANYEKVAGQSVEELIDALCKDSPKAREIREVRNG